MAGKASPSVKLTPNGVIEIKFSAIASASVPDSISHAGASPPIL